MKRQSEFTLRNRSAGLLLHPTSLPGPYHIGDLGPEAHATVRFLARAGLRWWQMLPTTPIGPGNSPYSSSSAFAISPLLISHQRLADDGWIGREELPPSMPSKSRASFPAAVRIREIATRRAFERYRGGRTPRSVRGRFDSAADASASWIADYAAFAALRRANRNRPWFEWPRRLRDRESAALQAASRELRDEIEYQRFIHFLAQDQWRALRRACHAAGIGLLGDIPIFVSHDSADVWANRHLFQLDRHGRARRVSGCPPDSFSKTGQLWGHPLYDWKAHEAEGFAWWTARLRRTFEQFDAARIDHFLGFHRCWSIAGKAKTAEHGRWEPSPGRELVEAARKKLGRLEIVAEDLGAVTPEAAKLRDELALPGMRILQNGFGESARFDQPHNHVRNCAAYTGTHDNDTVVGWFRALSRGSAARRGRDGLNTRERVLRYLHSDGREIHWDMLRGLFGSPADTAIAPVQDLLGLGSAARMNVPGVAGGNWSWRLTPGALTDQLAARVRDLAETFERT